MLKNVNDLNRAMKERCLRFSWFCTLLGFLQFTFCDDKTPCCLQHHKAVNTLHSTIYTLQLYICKCSCLEVRGNIIRTVLSCVVYWSCAQS